MPNELEAVDRPLETDGSERDSAARPPRAVVAIAVVALALGIFTSPDSLMAAGRLRWTLTQMGEMVRRATEIEILAFRVLCIAIALLPLFWGRIVGSPLVRRVNRHEPRELGWVRSRSAFLNFSLFASLSCAVGGLAYIVVGERIFTPAQLTFINEEDGVIEYTTALLFLICSPIALALACRHRADRRRAVIFLLFAAVFFLACGEEVSWGQRVFGMETLEVLKEVNAQGENNLHNMFGYMADHIFFFGVLAYGTILPLLAWKFRFFHKLFDYLGLPIASLGLGLGFFAGSCFQDWTPGAVDGYLPGLRTAELRELLSATGFLLLMIEAWRKAPEDRRPNPAAIPA